MIIVQHTLQNMTSKIYHLTSEIFVSKSNLIVITWTKVRGICLLLHHQYFMVVANILQCSALYVINTSIHRQKNPILRMITSNRQFTQTHVYFFHNSYPFFFIHISRFLHENLPAIRITVIVAQVLVRKCSTSTRFTSAHEQLWTIISCSTFTPAYFSSNILNLSSSFHFFC